VYYITSSLLLSHSMLLNSLNYRQGNWLIHHLPVVFQGPLPPVPTSLAINNQYHSDGTTAESLNNHYANICTDTNYIPPTWTVSSANTKKDYVSGLKIFSILDSLRPTAVGLDGLPAWFLKVGAPVFCEPMTTLFNLSLVTSTVPQQWQHAMIRPKLKLNSPSQHADFRPISITPILSRIMERTIV